MEEGRRPDHSIFWDDRLRTMKYVDADDPGEGGFCFPGDPQPYTPDFDDLAFQETLVPNDQYGWLGFEDQGEWIIPLSPLNWMICPFIDFVDGPEVEDTTQPGRYLTRWRVIYDRTIREFRYGIAGQPQLPPDPALGITPITLPTAGAQVSLGFDQDARACFAYQLNANQIRLTRFVAGVPTNYTWLGINPRLLFDGILQPDLASVDLVCCYVSAVGNVCIRMQRDNFAVEYIQITPASIPAKRITKVDRYQSYLYLYYVDITNIRYLARSKVYPPFPLFEEDIASSTSFASGGSYDPLVVDGGTYEDDGINTTIAVSGEYVLNTITTGPYNDNASGSTVVTSGSYDLIVIAGGTYEDMSVTNSIISSGSYDLTSVDGGTYVETAVSGTSPVSGTYS